MKYIPEDTTVALAEVPDEISLAINLSNCPHRCPGCHSPYLQKNEGEDLTIDIVESLIKKNKGISCVLFMGGDADASSLVFMVSKLKELHKDLKFAVYSGNGLVRPDYCEIFDYIKIGSYIKDLGGLDSEKTNQRFYKIEKDENGKVVLPLVDETYKFRKK